MNAVAVPPVVDLQESELESLENRRRRGMSVDRTSSGAGAGAGLEYDMWEGQFQFLGPNGALMATSPVAHNFGENYDQESIESPNSEGYKVTQVNRWCDHLTDHVQLLQEQMDALADTRSAGEERYARAKQENATLQARVLMLEEAQRDAETRAEERLQAEQRRHREWAGRLERERQLQLENYAIRLQAAEVESTNLRDEAARLREQLEKARSERTAFQEAAEDARRESQEAQEAERKAIAKANEAQSLMEAAREELIARTTEDQHRLEELLQEVTRLRARNKSLEECRDELQAAAALQVGRELLMLNPCARDNINAEASLAAELREGMSQDQVINCLCPCHYATVPDGGKKLINLTNGTFFNDQKQLEAYYPTCLILYKRNIESLRDNFENLILARGKKSPSGNELVSHNFGSRDIKDFHQSTDSIDLFQCEPPDFSIDYPIRGVIKILLELYQYTRNPVM